MIEVPVEGMAGDRVAIAVDPESVTLATERAFSIALITNELVSNAVKHGFPDDAAGRIESVNGSVKPLRMLYSRLPADTPSTVTTSAL